MKIFRRSYLPEVIYYNMREYKCNPFVSASRLAGHRTSLSTIQTQLRLQGRYAVMVKVISRNLKGKTDLYGNPYKPTEHIFTTNNN